MNTWINNLPREEAETQAMETPSLRVAIYIRVSTEDQVDGNSLTTQEEDCRRYAKHKNWQVVGVYNDEGYSGAKLDRPELGRMLEDATAGLIDVICVWRCDRFTRKTRDFLNLLYDLNEQGVKFAAATQDFDTTTPMGKALAVFIALVAEMERENIIARILPNMKKGAERGDWQGGTAPYGYKLIHGKKGTDGKRLEPSRLEVVPEEAAVIQRIFEMCLEGKGMRTIALALNTEGVPKPNGCEWGNTHIHKIVKSPIYLGHYVWNRRDSHSKRPKKISEWVVNENLYVPIIDEATFNAVHLVLKERSVEHVTRQLTSDYLLTGVLHCGKCGGKMIGTRRIVNNRTKAKRRTYRCTASHSGRHRCRTNSVDADTIEKTALSLINDLSRHPEILAHVKSHAEQLFASAATPKSQDELVKLRANLEEVRRQREKLLDTILRDDENESDDVAKSRYMGLNLTAKELENQIQKTECRLYSSSAQATSVAQALRVLESLDTIWDELTPPEQRQLFQCVFDRMEVNDGYLIGTTPAEAFTPYVEPLAKPIWCLAWERNIKVLNSEVRDLRGTKTLRVFAKELGMSETHLGAVERGIDPMSDFVRGKLDAWRAGQTACV